MSSILLQCLRHYFELWVMFEKIDTAGDRRIDMNEFRASLPKLAQWGFWKRAEGAGLVWVINGTSQVMAEILSTIWSTMLAKIWATILIQILVKMSAKVLPRS